MAQKRRVFRTDRELLLQLQLVHRADHALVPLDRRRVRLAHLCHTFTQRSRVHAQRSRIRCKTPGIKRCSVEPAGSFVPAPRSARTGCRLRRRGGAAGRAPAGAGRSGETSARARAPPPAAAAAALLVLQSLRLSLLLPLLLQESLPLFRS